MQEEDRNKLLETLSSDICQILVDQLETQINSSHKKRLERLKIEEFELSKVVSIRSPMLRRGFSDGLRYPLNNYLIEKFKEGIFLANTPDFVKRNSILKSNYLLHIFMNKLVEEEVVYAYIPCYHTGGHECCCIRY